MTALVSPHVMLNSYTITFATFAGMQKYVDHWKKAQKLRKSSTAKSAENTKPGYNLLKLTDVIYYLSDWP